MTSSKRVSKKQDQFQPSHKDARRPRLKKSGQPEHASSPKDNSKRAKGLFKAWQKRDLQLEAAGLSFLEIQAQQLQAVKRVEWIGYAVCEPRFAQRVYRKCKCLFSAALCPSLLLQLLEGNISESVYLLQKLQTLRMVRMSVPSYALASIYCHQQGKPWLPVEQCLSCAGLQLHMGHRVCKDWMARPSVRVHNCIFTVMCMFLNQAHTVDRRDTACFSLSLLHLHSCMSTRHFDMLAMHLWTSSHLSVKALF